MYRLFVIAKNNIKKQKGDMITFFIMTFITALLIFDCASAIVGLGRVLEDRYKAVNGADIFLFSFDTEAERDSAQRAIKGEPHIKLYEGTPAIKFITDYRKKGDEKYSNYEFYAETIGQDEESCVVYGMPKVAFDIGAVKYKLGLQVIPSKIYQLLEGRGGSI